MEFLGWLPSIHLPASPQAFFHPVAGQRMNIVYQQEPDLPVAEFIDVLVRSTLGERRPIHAVAAMESMLRHADIICTARMGPLLVGVARALTDFSFCTYLSDLAVDEQYQRQGIGKALIRQVHEAAGLVTSLILLAAPKAQGYYPRIGLTRHESCWVIPAGPR